METYKQMHDKAKKGNGLKSLTPPYFKFKKVGDQIVGAFISKNAVSSGLSDKTYNQYLFETDQGNTKFHMGSAGDSDFGEVFAQGCVYVVEFQGKEDLKGGKSVNIFDVFEITGAEVAEPEPEKE